jgi:hypothetical protein
MQTQDKAAVKFASRVIIEDTNTGEIFLDDCNAVHPENMAYIIARGLANQNKSHIWKVAVGNGGSYVDSTGALHFNIPNTIGTTAKLYNETYSEFADAAGNSVTAMASTTDVTSLVEVIFTIAPDEPGSGQWLTDADGAGNINEPGGYAFEFDELGLFAESDDVNHPYLLTHIVFHPIAKTQNRNLRLRYTLTISVS